MAQPNNHEDVRLTLFRSCNHRFSDAPGFGHDTRKDGGKHREQCVICGALRWTNCDSTIRVMWLPGFYDQTVSHDNQGQAIGRNT